MATNKELNEKIDNLTAMFNAFLEKYSDVSLNQGHERAMILEAIHKDKSTSFDVEKEERAVIKKRGRPNKKIESAEEIRISKGGKTVWKNYFVDNGNEHLEDREIDKKLQIKPPSEKGVRKNPMVVSKCSYCGKIDKIHKQFSFEGSHTCQRCLKNKVGK